MGFFDFLKPRRDPIQDLLANPLVGRARIEGKLEFVERQVSHLKAVGRDLDAKKLVSEYLGEVIQESKSEPQNPFYFSLLANASIILGALDTGKEMLNAVIQANKEKPFMDLTLVYMGLGKIYHQLRSDPEKELWCYEKATEASAPPNCKFPASQKDKAKAHDFAYRCADRISSNDRAKYHDSKRRGFAPDLDWDDVSEVIKWFQQ